VPHEKIVDECIEALYGKLCGGHIEHSSDSLGAP
jgi:hypothetical protein